MTNTLETLIASARPAMAADAETVRRRLDDLTKPPGSLGRLEETALRLALLCGDPPPALRRRVVLVFAADHGVARAGVSAWPQEVTVQMCRTIAEGGAAICTIARAVDADVRLIDVGVAGDLPAHPLVTTRRVAGGTEDLSRTAAMTRDQAVAAILTGAEAARDALRDADVLALGELGIGNTTAASALTAAMLGLDPDPLVGRGAGLDDAGLARKRAVVRRAVERARATGSSDPITLLAELGGLEIAALVGAMLAGAVGARPVVLDGFIVTAAALVAQRLAPEAKAAMFCAHRSEEPGHAVQLAALGLDPLLSLGLRLGEGTGAALALPLLEAAAGMLREMSTFSGAGVSGRSRDCTPERVPCT